MDEHFIILGLPRSMTAWVSCFLTCGEVFCQHELAEKMPIEDIIDEIRSPIFPVSGICDSGLLAYWASGFFEKFPKSRYVFIERNKAEACQSFVDATGIEAKTAIPIFDGLEGIAKRFVMWENPMVISTDELQTEDGARRLWNYCAPHHPLPPAHLRKMMSLKVTVHPKVYAEAAATLNQLATV